MSLFNIFKKKQIETVSVFDSNIIKTAANNNYPDVVVQIHNEFNSAADRLIEEANVIINDAKLKDSNKVGRLEKLGFKQANQVTELKPLIQKAELSKEQIELLSHYSRSYPLNKFITEDQVKAICYKYNLICGEVGRYRGFVPEKNLKEIEGFKLKDSDKELVYKFGDGFYTWDELTLDRLSIGSFYNHHPTSYDELKRKGKPDNSSYYPSSKYADAELKICAPVKDMDLTGMTIEDGYKMKKVHVPDPVVLQPVKGGYLIVTAWGDEASDDIVSNPINN